MYNNIDIIGGAITFFLNFWFELVYLSGKKNVWIEIENRTLFSKIDKIKFVFALNENVDNNFQKSCVLPGDSVVISEGTFTLMQFSKIFAKSLILNFLTKSENLRDSDFTFLFRVRPNWKFLQRLMPKVSICPNPILEF